MSELSDYRPVKERVLDWKEVNRSAIASVGQERAKSCLDCGVPFCQSETGCPVDNLIPDWNKLVAQNRWQEAYNRLQQTNNFPEFTGGLCPAPCESACVAGINEKSVAIKSIEWSIIDRAFKEGWVKPQVAKQLTGKKIAIVGSGPAGLAAAQQLARAGHSVSVFEKQAQIGGLIRYGIPDFKFEKWRIDQRLEQLKAEGITFNTAVSVGQDISFAQLKTDYDAIGLAMGAERARDIAIPGRSLKGIHLAMDFLVDQNKVNSKEKSELSISAAGKNVVILGGGDTGSDCLGTALRQGARSVTQIELRPMPLPHRSSLAPWPKYSDELRTSHAHEEGGRRLWGLMTSRFEGRNDSVEKVVAQAAEFKNGRFEFTANSSEQTFNADLVILALGFEGSDVAFLKQQLSVKLNNESRLQPTVTPGVFAAGDLCRGASLIVWAIASGRSMAEQINEYLKVRS